MIVAIVVVLVVLIREHAIKKDEVDDQNDEAHMKKKEKYRFSQDSKEPTSADK